MHRKNYRNAKGQFSEGNKFIALKWFRDNEMKSNDDKCHLIIANKENEFINIGSEVIQSSESVDLLGITIDKKTLILLIMLPA